MGSAAQGLYGLLRGVTSCSHPLPSQPPLKRSHLTPSSTAPQPPLLESTGPEASDPASQATVSTSPAATPAPEEDIPAHMQPLRIQVGCQKNISVPGLRLQRGPINLTGYHLCPHEKGTPGGGVVVLPLWQDLFQSRCSEAPQKNSHLNY